MGSAAEVGLGSVRQGGVFGSKAGSSRQDVSVRIGKYFYNLNVVFDMLLGWRRIFFRIDGLGD
jgi:hypothetical protein